MGSWFSSPNVAGDDDQDFVARFQQLMDRGRAVNHHTQEEMDAYCIRDLADWALQHYNAYHSGAEFRLPGLPIMACVGFVYPDQPTAHFKVDCVGFRDNLWYHVNFSACQTDHGDEHNFFAELRYDWCSRNLIIQTCTILEEPLDYFRSSCALCQVESKILHRNDVELGCGKDGHEKEFFRERCSWNGKTREFFTRSDMLKTPFVLGGEGPQYRLD